jgi:hypothetical protein
VFMSAKVFKLYRIILFMFPKTFINLRNVSSSIKYEVQFFIILIKYLNLVLAKI